MNLPAHYPSLTWQERREVRTQYWANQGGACAHCGEHLTDEPRKDVRDAKINWRLFPPNFTKYPVHLHHCHKTGMTIGAIHARCNAWLWQYKGE
jgi:hypothetical protein